MAEASDDSPDNTTEREEPQQDVPSENDGKQESADLDEENYVQILDPDGDPESDRLAPTIWGRFWGMGEGESVAFYWQFDPDQLDNSNNSVDEIPDRGEVPEDQPADGDEDGTDQDNGNGPKLFNEHLYAAFGEPASLKTYDPGLRRREFRKRLQDYNVDESPVPQVTIDDLTETFSDFLEKPKIIWLQDFIQSGDHGDINGWFARLLEELNPSEEYRYQLRAQLVDPTEAPVEVVEDVPEGEEESEEDGEDETSARILSISLMTDPQNGIEPTELTEGMEVFYRIVGDVGFLPDNLIDRDRQETASIPMTGSVVSVESNPDIPGDRDADPENYRRLEVKIDDDIHGEGLAFKDDRIKVPVDDDEEEDTTTRDIILLGISLALLLVIVVLILYL